MRPVSLFLVGILIFEISDFIDSIYLFQTDVSQSVYEYDCLWIKQVKFCRRLSTNENISRDKSTCFHKRNRVITYQALAQSNISGEELLKWNGDLDVADEYARWLFYRDQSTKEMSLCNCTKEYTYGPSCFYQYDEFKKRENFESDLSQVFSRREYLYYYQIYGNILCYKGLIQCNYGLLCLDWRNICDGQQNCMDGIDEENCDKLEFNECDENEYRCINGMCIPEEYFLDGEFDCMDHSDEQESSLTQECVVLYEPFNCDEHICPRRYSWSCGDGQCIEVIRNDKDFSDVLLCINMRHFYYICELHPLDLLMTQPSGMCKQTSNFIKDRKIHNQTRSHITCADRLICCFLQGESDLCPCKSLHECYVHLKNACPQQILYPSRPLFAPYLNIFYEVNSTSPKLVQISEYRLTGRIKCRGYQIEFTNHSIKVSDDNMIKPDLTEIEYYLCSLTNIHKNYSMTARQYDRHCHNQSKTFSQHIYASSDLCMECVSNYRISDGIIDCASGKDEHQYQSKILPCLHQQNYRLLCQSKQRIMCLYLSSIGNRRIDCSNGIDEYLQGSEMSLNSVKCLARKNYLHTCNDLRNYIMSNGQTHITIANSFSRYCDTLWDISDSSDESPENCRQYWICPNNYYRCTTGQCIPLNWVCDNEWDCADGSDEEKLLSIHEYSLHNLKLKDKITEHFKNNPPCIEYDEINNGIINCYGGLDERNSLKECGKNSVLGFNFQCPSTNTCIPYNRLCIDRCPNREDDLLCSLRQRNNQRTCGIQCNKQPECPNGEDEYWCDYTMEFRYPFSFYQYRRTKKSTTGLKSHQLQDFPLMRLNDYIFQETLSEFDQQRKFAFHCNRGIVLTNNDNKLICLCSASYYGDKCQYYNDRITIFTHLDLLNSSYAFSNDMAIILSVVVFFLYEKTSVIDSYVFHVYPKFETDSPKKQRFLFSYPRLNSLLKKRIERYFNRTDINEHQPFSVRFELFQLTTTIIERIAVWNFPIYFDYLPSFRLAKILHLPSAEYLHNSCINNNCNSNSICQPVINEKNSFICICKSGCFGQNCSKFHSPCQNACSVSAICRYNGNNRPICICPLGYFGRSCSLRYFQCQSSPCLNGGTCQHSVSPTTLLCRCLESFYGDRCEHTLTSAILRLNHTNENNLIKTNEIYGIILQGFTKTNFELINQQSYVDYLPELFVFSNSFFYIPEIILMKLYQLEKQELLFVMSLLPNETASYLNISVELSTKNLCPHSSSLLKGNFSKRNLIFQYHFICQNHTELLCFQDEIHFCICDRNISQRAECFSYNNQLDQCTKCLSDGKCLRGNPKIPNDFLCLCPDCYYGRLCQFRIQIFSFTLGSLLNNEPMYVHYISIGFIFFLFLIGILNNMCSFMTMERKIPRKLLVSKLISIVAILNQFSLLFLLFQIVYMFMGTNGIFKNFSKLNKILCQSLTYLSSTFTRSNHWLTSWITIIRVCVVFCLRKDLFNRLRFKYTMMIIIITLILVFLTHVHEIFYSIIVEDTNSQTYCLINYPRNFLAIYNRINVMIQLILPFFIQTISITVIIVTRTFQQTKFRVKNLTIPQILLKELQAQKEICLTSIIMIISALPHTVISFSFTCREITQSWQQHLLLLTYIFSYIPQIFSFFILILPSTIYKKEFDETCIGKKSSILIPKLWKSNNKLLSTY